MKVFLLEPDRELANEIDIGLNSLRLKMKIKKVQFEEDLRQEAPLFSSYALFILNLKNPTNPCIMKFIRENGGDAPILLILESDVDTAILKTLYYLGYDDVIIKNFTPDEIAFRVYKLCDIWNNDNFFLNKDIYFDFKHCKFVNQEREIILGKKESLLLKFLSVKAPYCVSFAEISCYVYQDEVASEERIRSLVRQLRSKVPHELIETIKGEGYKIANCTLEKST